ncbi:GAF domain-containing protein [Fulvivirga sp. 29W222]|uniref:GAF domain-containing protein n=1 Tax=Fulvivirga marina TaxID=2494733 RepID=A0A937FYD4_9BACT|nr:GAF domain-containing protein [Fulvivirga marina]MBL6447253.1 GAF domain-containing protein [Fulvivirga marina]
MKFEYRKLSIVLIAIYSACMIFTAYELFQLPDDLVYGSQVLSAGDLKATGFVFVKLYVVVGITMIVGMAALATSLNKKSSEVIYVEKKKSASEQSSKEDEENINSHTLDISAVKDIIASESDKDKLAKEILTHLCKHLDAGIGAFYTTSKEGDKRIVEMQASYALILGESETIKFEYGEGLVGQVALEEKTLIIDDIPEGYVKIVSGLGSATPTHLLVVPVKNGDSLYGVVEIASFTNLGKADAEMVAAAFKQLTQKLFGTAKTTKKTADTKEVKEGDLNKKGGE